jgi:hypothetical protein
MVIAPSMTAVIQNTSKEHIWRICIVISILALAIFLTLNSTNIYPKRPHHRFSGTISERGFIEGKAIKLHPESGLQSKDILTLAHPSKITPTNGLSLKSLPPKSILANIHPEKAGIPTGLILPTNSILTSTDSGLQPLVATQANTVLTFDGDRLLWATPSQKMPTLKFGNIFVGDENDLAAEVNITGDVEMDSKGNITLNRNTITSDKIVDAHVTPAKISNGEEGQVLTSISGRPKWEFPSHDIRCNIVTELQNSSGAQYSFIHHDYTYQGSDAISYDGQSIKVTAFGSKLETSKEVQFGITLEDFGQSSEEYMLSLPVVSTVWKLEAHIIRTSPQGGRLTVTIWLGKSFLYSSFPIQKNGAWDGEVHTMFVSKIHSDESSETAPISIEYSSLA